ncbi:MAG: acetyl-CoA carboxylase biotin carboxyl carrier protein subunit [Saprospiraceae bacterium]
MAIYQVLTNGEKKDIDTQELTDLDIVPTGPQQYHLLKDGIRYDVEVLNLNHTEKTLLLLINGQKVNVEIKDQYDLLVHRLGLSKVNLVQEKEIKAPMPGLIVDVLVEPGTQVEKGTPLLILEAMKMENMLKATSDGLVESVLVSKGQTVDKNQVLIALD